MTGWVALYEEEERPPSLSMASPEKGNVSTVRMWLAGCKSGRGLSPTTESADPLILDFPVYRTARN